MAKKWFGISVMVFGFVFLGACATNSGIDRDGLVVELSEVTYNEISFEELRSILNNLTSRDSTNRNPEYRFTGFHEQGFKVQAYVGGRYSSGNNLIPSRIGDERPIIEQTSMFQWVANIPNGIDIGFDLTGVNGEQFEINRQYSLFIAVSEYREHRGSGIRTSADVVQIEGLRSLEEVQTMRLENRRRAFWAIRNPDNLNRSEYTRMSASDFSFNMVAGNLPVGSKVRFTTRFLTRPTSPRYMFADVNPLLTLTSRHNFAGNMGREYFEHTRILGHLHEPAQVNVYVTVTRTGQMGEATIDIMSWGREP